MSDHTRKTARRLMVICGMSDKKLQQKIAPLQALPDVDEILLVRKQPYHGKKIRCYAVPRIFRGIKPLAEAWRLATVFLLCLFRRPRAAIGMTLILHCFHVYFAKRVFGIPAVFHIMGKQDLQLHDPSRRRLQQFMWKVACKADVLVVRGDRTREAFIRKGRFPADRIFVQQNVFDFRGYEPSKGPKDYDLVYVGYLAPYKHLHLLIEVVKQCAERGHAIHLALAGEGRLKTQIIHQAEQAGVIDQLHFLGTLDEPELIDALQRSRIFAMTSLGEGLPQAMIEALACGLPCVMFDDADIGQVITSGENGFLVPPGDTRAFTDAVIQLLDDVERYRRMSSNAAAIREQHSEQCSLYAQQKVWAKIVNTSLRT